MEATPKNAKVGPKRHIFWAITAIIVITILAGLLVWCYWWKVHPVPTEPVSPGSSSGSSSAVTTGPCKDGAANTAPADYTFYENADLGFKFAYPSSWGAVSISTSITGMGGSGGEYLNGTFAANSFMKFGGNATNFIVKGREVLPLDLPGFLKANDKFYIVEIWHYSPPAGPVEDRHTLQPIEEAVTEKATCNTSAIVVTRTPGIIGPDYTYDRASVNLQPTNKYFGVNFELKEPNTVRRAELDNILKTFQLIP
jgi:hypothetical protein